jgi:hypothetical protein
VGRAVAWGNLVPFGGGAALDNIKYERALMASACREYVDCKDVKSEVVSARDIQLAIALDEAT